MRYLVTGKLYNTVAIRQTPREEYLVQLQQRIIPTLQELLAHKGKGTVLGGGVIPLDTLIFIVDIPDQSMVAVRSFLWGLPAFELFDWDIKPMETFEEIVAFFDPNR